MVTDASYFSVDDLIKALERWEAAFTSVKFRSEIVPEQQRYSRLYFLIKLLLLRIINTFGFPFSNEFSLIPHWEKNGEILASWKSKKSIHNFLNQIENSLKLLPPFPRFGENIPDFKSALEDSEMNWVQVSQVLKEIVGISSPLAQNQLVGLLQYDFSIWVDHPENFTDLFSRIYEWFFSPFRHEEGIYFTSHEISKYITNQTVRRHVNLIIENIHATIHKESDSKQNQILQELFQFRTLDPACGSGAFLIQIFDIFFEIYTRLEREISPELDLGYHSAPEKIRTIVLRHIFGVERDPFILEIAILNLWLHILVKFRNSMTALKLSEIQSILPPLGLNLLPRNALVGFTPEYTIQYFESLPSDTLKRLSSSYQAFIVQFGDLEAYNKIQNINTELRHALTSNFAVFIEKIKAPSEILLENAIYWGLDFFPAFFHPTGLLLPPQHRGFTCVIGNPPYKRAATFVQWKKYYLNAFSTIFGACDMYVPFIERGLDVLQSAGLLSFIVSNKLLLKDYASRLRDMLFNYELIELVDLTKCQSIFENVYISPLIFTVQKNSFPINNPDHTIRLVQFNQDTPHLLNLDNISSSNDEYHVEYRLQRYLRDKKGHFAMNLTPEFHSLIEKIYKEATPYKNLAQIHTGLMGFVYDKIGHYVSESPKETEKTADNPNRSLDNKLEFISNGLIDRYQLRWGEKSIKLFKRKYQHPQLTNNSWVSKETWNRYCQPKVLIRGVARRLIAAYDSVGRAFSVEVIGVISEKISPTTQLALLNSILFNWLHLVEYQLGQIPRGSLSYPKPFVENLPIRQEKWFDQLATELVPQLESLSPKSHEFHEIQTQINLAVFRLYGLSEENQKQIYTFLDTFSLDKIY